MTLKEMREKMASLLAQARSKFDEIKDDTPEARAAEIEREYDAIMADYDKLQAKHDRQAALETAESRAEEQIAEARESRLPGAPAPGEPADPAARAAVPTYSAVFRNALLRGVHNLPQDQMAVFEAVQRGMNQGDVAEMEQRAMSVGTPSEGGYFVPDEFSGMLIQQMEDWGAMYAENATAQISTPTGNSLLIPTLDYTAERGELHAENGAVTDDGSADPVIGQKQMDAYFYNTPIVPFSLELLNDSEFAIEPLLSQLFGQSLGRTANEVLTNGDGSSKPQGILTGATDSGVTVSAPAVIDPDDLISLVHSVDPAYRRSPMSKFQFNDSTLAVLRKLKDGQDNYLWQMGDVRTGEPNQLLGHSYMINSAMPDIGASATPILYGDHSQYMVRKVGDFSVVPFREKFMNKLQIGLMAFMRFDGEILNASALKKLTMAAS